MTEVDRDIALVLLKRLWKRNLITEEVYVAACNSKYFDRKNFTPVAESFETETEIENSDEVAGGVIK